MAKRILMIDDEPNTIEVVGDRLKEMGYEFEGRSNPKEGQWATSKTRPDLIVLDINMPGWNDGIGFLDSIRHHPNLLGIPIVIYTSLNIRELRRGAEEAGAAGYYQKLSEDKAFYDKIKKLLG